jgi:hypothetical protein
MRFQLKIEGEEAFCNPGAGAVAGRIERWDMRWFKSPEEHDEKLVHDFRWSERGTDHKILLDEEGESRGIARKMGEEDAWFVEIEYLGQLMELFEKFGDLTIRTSISDHETPCIEVER